MTITGPYYTSQPRYSGEFWKVTVRKGSAILTRGFHTESDARDFIAIVEENNS
jgi:hypothetical protein